MPSDQAGKLSAAARRKLAEEFVATAVWSLLDSHGTAVSDEHPEGRATIRVFAKGCPAHALRDVHAALARQTPLKDPLVGGVVIPGTWYHKTSLWSKDERTGESGQGTFTLLRVLSDGPAGETDVVEDGCGSKTTIRFVWDVSDIESFSDILNPATDAPYGQGFSVRIGGVNRDTESNLVSYYVTVTERKAQYVPQYVSGDDAMATDYDAVWLGLRGTTGSPSTATGAHVSVLKPADAAPGETVSVQWERSLEDCTLSARGKKRVSKQNVKVARSCTKNLFAERDGENVSGAPVPLDEHVPEPSAGVVWSHQSKLRPDRLWDTDKGKDTEKTVEEARKSTEETKFTRTVTTAGKSLTSAPEASFVSNGLIRVVALDKTPGNLLDASVVERLEKPVSRSRVSKSATVFGTEESVTDMHQAAEPAAPSAGSGVQESASSEITEGDLRNNQKSTRRSIPVADAVIARSQDAFSKTESVTDRNQISRKADFVAVSGGVVTEEHGELNPDGSFDNVKGTRQSLPVSGVTVSKAQDLFRTSEASVSRGQPSRVAGLFEAAGGVVRQQHSEMAADGTFANSDSVETEKTVEEARKSTEETKFTRTVTVSGKSLATSPSPSSVSRGLIRVVAVDKTPGNLLDANVVERREKPVPRSRVSKSATVFGTEESVSDMHQASGPANPVAGSGVQESVSSEVTEGDLLNNQKSVRRSIPVSDAVIARSQDVFSQTESITDRSQLARKADFVAVSGGVVTEAHGELNPDGSFDNVKSTRKALPVTGASVSKAQDLFSKSESSVDRGQVTRAAELFEAAGGVVRQQRSEMASDGSFVNSDSVDTERPVMGSSERIRVLPWMVEKTVTDTNAGAPFTPGDLEVVNGRALGSIENQKTRGGLYIRTKVTASGVVSGTVLSHTKTGHMFESTEVKRTIETVKDFGITGLINGGVEGVASIRTVDFDWNELGYYVKTETVRTVAPRRFIFTDKTYFNTKDDVHIQRYFYSYSNIDESSVLELLTRYNAVGDLKVSHSERLNEFGLYSGVFSYSQVESTEEG